MTRALPSFLTRPRLIAIALALLLLAAAPFVPRGSREDGAISPSATETRARLAHAVAGRTPLTASAVAEIDRVASAALTTSRLTAPSTPTALVAAFVRCADFEGQRYCLHIGWTESTEDEVVADQQAAATRLADRPGVAGTGDATLLTTLRRTARLTPEQREAADRAEFTEAAHAVAKVWLLRNQVEGVALPDGFLDRHPEIQLGTGEWSRQARPAGREAVATANTSSSASPSPSATSTTKPSSAYPKSDTVLDTSQVAEQLRSYWCGPTSMQMIAWGWKHVKWSQELWADKLGTTSNGTSVTDMVRVTNSSTGWDNDNHAGPYVVVDIGDYPFWKWNLLLMRHVTDYRAPVILHPVLLERYYPYLDDDGSGHYQVGRGYNQNGDKSNLISFFEPWNQQRFDPSEPYISRVQWRSAYKSYRANLAHPQHNIGV